MKNFSLVFVVLAVVLCVFSVPVRAELITIAISGQVTGVDDPSGHFGGQITVGNPITGTYTYDTAILDSNPDPMAGYYSYSTAPAGIHLAIGNFEFKTDSTHVAFTIGVTNNNLLGGDVYWLDSSHNLPLPNGTLVQYISWQLNDPAGTALSNDALPLTAPDLSKWSSNTLNIFRDRDYGITATITSATPEPATVFLLSLGAMLIRKRFSN